MGFYFGMVIHNPIVPDEQISEEITLYLMKMSNVKIQMPIADYRHEPLKGCQEDMQQVE
jgi:hypothetical protein